jgi:hypothetical protein
MERVGHAGTTGAVVMMIGLHRTSMASIFVKLEELERNIPFRNISCYHVIKV